MHDYLEQGSLNGIGTLIAYVKQIVSFKKQY